MRKILCLATLLAAPLLLAGAQVVFETTSPYHHILVIDERGLRTLSFDGTMESRMSLVDPAQGHFEYTEYFQMPWLWNQQLSNVLMIGLGGASTQRTFQKYYPLTHVETAELDPMVLKVATNYFHFLPTLTNHVTICDGRVFLRRTDKKYDALILDAYVKSRYGSFIPYHLTTQEFFRLCDEHLTDNGVIAYNVIGTLQGWRADILGSMYRTMKSVFPQVYLFPATDSLNVVLVATKSKERVTQPLALARATDLVRTGVVSMPTFITRAAAFRRDPPPSFQRSPILTDDYAPVDGLLRGRN
jgi:spermidine synthase